MFVSEGLGINDKNHLTVCGHDIVSLAEKHGTPLMIYDEEKIRKSMRLYKLSIDENYNGNGMVLYAGKAFSCIEMCRICSEEGLGLDTVSAGEIYTALKSGFNMENVYFHGNNKTDEELKMAIECGVGHIVADNYDELERINLFAKKSDRKIKVLLRIKPGIEAHTHEYIKTGQIDSKFGFALETGEALKAVESSLKNENLFLEGLHCHIGSQIFDVEPFELAAEKMICFISEIKKSHNYEIQTLNLGGGFGIKYIQDDNAPDYSEYMEKVSLVIKEKCKKLCLPLPYILIEPGRSIVGEAGVTAYRVGSIKRIPNVRTYVSIDGGMTDNPRYILYKSKYEFLIANRVSKKRDFKCTVAGKCCESGDLIGEDVFIQKPETGDILVTLSTGAYNYSMSSNYNRIPRPLILMVKSGKVREIVKRERLDDIISRDI